VQEIILIDNNRAQAQKQIIFFVFDSPDENIIDAINLPV